MTLSGRRMLVGGMLCAGLVAAGSPAAVAEPLRLTIAEALAGALKIGAEARIARLETSQAEHAAGEARSAFLPHVAITSGAGYSNRQSDKLRAVNRNGVEHVYGLASLGSTDGWFNLFIDQLLFDLRRSKQVESAHIQSEAARVAEAQRHEAIAQEVLGLYLDVVRIEQQVRLAEGMLEKAGDLSRQASSLVEAGAALASEREEVEVLREEVRLAVDEAVLKLATARADLAAACGVDIARADDLVVVPRSLPEADVGDTVSLNDEVLASTAEMRALELRRRLESLRSEAARASRLPTLGLRGGYSNYGTNRYDNFPDEWRIGVDIRVPLFDGLHAHHEISRAVNAEEIARIEYRLALDRKRRRITDLANRVQLGARATTLAERARLNAARRLDLVDRRLRAKRGLVGDAVDARVRYRDAATRAIDARFEQLRLWAMLEREFGRLSTVLQTGGAALHTE